MLVDSVQIPTKSLNFPYAMLMGINKITQSGKAVRIVEAAESAESADVI